MRLGDVLQRVPGLEKRFVYYLEAQGVISPTRLPKSRIDRREYSAEDVGRLRRVWRHYRRGYALGTARELAEQEADCEAFALVGTLTRRRPEALEALRGSDRVVEAAGVYGQRIDLIVRLEAARDEDVLEGLHPAFDRGVLTGLPKILKTRPTDSPAGRPSRRASSKGGGMLAFVLLTVPAKHVDRTLGRLRELDGVLEASAVYGETDIIAKLDVADQPRLDELIVRQIQGLPEVEATRTFIVIGGLHWSRA